MYRGGCRVSPSVSRPFAVGGRRRLCRGARRRILPVRRTVAPFVWAYGCRKDSAQIRYSLVHRYDMNRSKSQEQAFNLKILVILSIGHMVTDIYQGALPTILPFLKDKLAFSYTMAGVIVLASNFTSSIIQPLFGYVSDRKEKPLLLPLGCLAAGVCLSFLSVPSNLALVLLLVIISGLGVASFHPEGYKTASYFTGDKSATGMSIFSVGGNLGFALGPIISLAIITYLGFDFLPIMAILPVLYVLLLSFTWNSLAKEKLVPVSEEGASNDTPRSAYVALILIVGTVVIRSWIQMGLMTYIPFYYIDYLKGDPLYAGTLVSVFLLAGVLGTLGGAPLADRWGHKEYLVATMALIALLLPLIFVTHGVALMATLAGIGGILISTWTVTIVMAQKLLPRSRGIASGLMVGFAIGTGGLGVTILGLIADNFGVPVALKSIVALPLVGLIFSVFVRYPPKRA